MKKFRDIVHYMNEVYKDIDISEDTKFINDRNFYKRKIIVDNKEYNYVDPDSNCEKLAEDFNEIFFDGKGKVIKERIKLDNWVEYDTQYIVFDDELKLGLDYIGPSTTSAYYYKCDDAWKKIYNGRVIGGHLVWPIITDSINKNKAYSGKQGFGISDRIDYALYEIKQYLDKKHNKEIVNSKVLNTNLKNALERQYFANEQFFKMFNYSFKKFCDFFELVGSFVDENYEVIMLDKDYDGDIRDKEYYENYAKKNIEAIEKRTERILNQINM